MNERAQQCTSEIRSWVELLADGHERVPELVIEAHREKYWAALDYPDWETYVRTEFGTGLLRLSVSVRRDWVDRLTEAGLSRKEIAPVVNVGTATVARDREAVSIDTPSSPTGFAIMPKLRWQLDGGKLILDLAEYRAAVRQLASIYPESWQPAIMDRYEHCLDGINALGEAGITVDLDRFERIADARVQEAAAHIGTVFGGDDDKSSGQRSVVGGLQQY